MRISVSDKSTGSDRQNWVWFMHCPECLVVRRLVREDFNGQLKIQFKCKSCGFKQEVENPEQEDLPSRQADPTRLSPH